MSQRGNVPTAIDLGPIRRGNFFPLLGNGIFTEDGKPWERSRAMMRPQFAREQVSDLDLEERHVQNMFRELDFFLQPDEWTDIVDLQVLFFRLTLDSATEFLFGESVDSQVTLAPGNTRTRGTVADANSLDFATAFDKGQMALAASNTRCARLLLTDVSRLEHGSWIFTISLTARSSENHARHVMPLLIILSPCRFAALPTIYI